MSNAFKALQAAAAARALPEHYVTDLTEHDKRNCEAHGDDEPFAWLLYRNGTHMVRPRIRADWPRDRKYYPGAELADIIEFNFATSTARAQWFWWNGAALHEVTFEQVQEQLRETERAMEAAA